eukprot:m.68433 g.68433  ORF g.68433 m.68433 type:complete len:803 (-) comp11967_c0_seq1:90-2498(-)
MSFLNFLRGVFASTVLLQVINFVSSHADYYNEGLEFQDDDFYDDTDNVIHEPTNCIWNLPFCSCQNMTRPRKTANLNYCQFSPNACNFTEVNCTLKNTTHLDALKQQLASVNPNNTMLPWSDTSFAVQMKLSITCGLQVETHNDTATVFSEFFSYFVLHLRTLEYEGHRTILFSKIFEGAQFQNLKVLQVSRCVPDNVGHSDDGEGVFELTRSMMAHFPQIYVLGLGRNKQLKLNADTFQNNTHLKRLGMDDNALSVIPPNVLRNLKNLTLLRLRNNSISFIPPNLFRHCPRLEYLELSHNQLTAFNMSVDGVNIVNLKYLGLTENKIRELPYDLLMRAVHLETMFLGHNLLTEAPDVRRMTSLRMLSLYSNNIVNPQHTQDTLNNLSQAINFLDPVVLCVITSENPVLCNLKYANDQTTSNRSVFFDQECGCAPGYARQKGRSTCVKIQRWKVYVPVGFAIVIAVGVLVFSFLKWQEYQKRKNIENYVNEVTRELDGSLLCSLSRETRDKIKHGFKLEWEKVKWDNREALTRFNRTCAEVEAKYNNDHSLIATQPSLAFLRRMYPDIQIGTIDDARKLFEALSHVWEDKLQNIVEESLQPLATHHNVEFIVGPMKNEGRVALKAMLKYKGNIEKVTDFFRGCLVFHSFDTMGEVLQELEHLVNPTTKEKLQIIRIKNRFDDSKKHDGKEDLFYKDCQIVLKEESTQCLFEVQLRYETLHKFSQEQGHKDYEKFRQMDEVDKFFREQLDMLRRRNTPDEVESKSSFPTWKKRNNTLQTVHYRGRKHDNTLLAGLLEDGAIEG